MSITNFRPIPTITVADDYWENGTWKFYMPEISPESSGEQWIEITLHGLGALTLINSLPDSLTALTLFGGTEQRNIPEGHTQLEYVYMTSGSYIKIEDLLISAGYRVEYEFQTTSLSTSLRNYIGGRANGLPAGGGFRLSKLANSNNDRVVLYGFETGTEYYDPTKAFQANTRYKYTYNNGVCTLESGGSVVSTQTFTITDNTSTKWGINCYISGNDYWQTGSDDIYAYSLKVWNPQGELVMDLVPDLTNSVVCFYDMVTGTIRTASEGTFTAGAEAVPTPDTPMDIVCNNGVLKVSPNLFDKNASYALFDGYLNNAGVGQNTTLVAYNGGDKTIIIKVAPNTTYTVTRATNLGSVYDRIRCAAFTTLPFSSLTGVILYNLSSNAQQANATFTTLSDTQYVAINVRNSGTVGDDWTQFVDAFQVELGSTATPYMPYGQVYTDGTTETVEVTGKNLFDKTQQSDTYFYTSNGEESSTTYYDVAFVHSGKIPCLPNTQYTLSGTRNLRGDQYYYKFTFWDKNGDFISYVNGTPVKALESYVRTATTPNNCYYIAFNSFDTDVNVMLELGSTATTYEPYYNGGSATAEMLLKIGNYQDIQSVLDGEVTRNIGIKVLDGTEDWERSNTQNDVYRLTLTDAKREQQAILSTHFIGTKAADVNMPSNSIKVGSYAAIPDYGVIAIRLTNVTALATFKQFLTDQYNAGTPVIVIYPLATATTESVTGQPLTIQEGTNIVQITQASMDNLELEVSYKAGVAVTITEIENAQLDNSVEVTING